MFVGEAPGANEDRLGAAVRRPRGNSCSRQLLGEIGLARADVFIANVLKCRPPGNRDPLPVEIDNCREYLLAQLELIQPKVVCTLGNFATKLLRDDPTGITRLHGQVELRDDRRPHRPALPAAASGGGALHAVQRRAAARGLRADSGAADAGGAAATVNDVRSREPAGDDGGAPEPEPGSDPAVVTPAAPEPREQLDLF